jgi:DNA-binding IclR family transcriptional regulator
VRIEAGPASVHVNMRHGTVMSTRGTASGRLFEAHRADPARRGSLTALERVAVRQAGFALAVDGTVAGVSALAVPVFDATGTMVLSLTAIGPSASLDVAAAGVPLRRLLAAAHGLSSQLGRPPAIHPAKPLAQMRR